MLRGDLLRIGLVREVVVVAVLIHDKALLDEEDILAANLLVYGKSETPMVKKIGSRWFVSVVVMSVPPNGGIRVSASSR